MELHRNQGQMPLEMKSESTVTANLGVLGRELNGVNFPG